MRKIILILFIISLGLTSCITEQKCAKKYPPITITKDSIVYETNTIYKDSVVTFYIIGDTVYQDSTIYVYKDVKTGFINSDSSQLSTEFATAIAWIENSELKHILRQHETIINQKIDSAVRITTEKLELFHSETVIKKNFITHWYDKVARIIAIIAILILIIYIAIKIIKLYIGMYIKK